MEQAADHTTDIDVTYVLQAERAPEIAPAPVRPDPPMILKPLTSETRAPVGKWAALKEKLHAGFMKAVDCETMKNADGRDFETEEIGLVHAFLKERGEDKIIHNSRGMAV